MEIKPVVVEVTAAERLTGEIRAHRVAELLGYSHPDSARAMCNRGKFLKVPGKVGLYDLASVLDYKRRREAGEDSDSETPEAA